METFNQPRNKTETRESGDRISADLKNRYNSETLTSPDQVHVVKSPEDGGDYLSIAYNQQEGARQYLRAMIKAGEEFFSVIDCSVDNNDGTKTDKSILARHVSGGRAEFAGEIGVNSVIKIGRGPDNDLNKTVSREHFAVAQDEKGQFAIVDLRSTNKTEVFYPKSDGSGISEIEDKNNPLNNINFWSVKSSELKKSI